MKEQQVKEVLSNYGLCVMVQILKEQEKLENYENCSVINKAISDSIYRKVITKKEYELIYKQPCAEWNYNFKVDSPYRKEVMFKAYLNDAKELIL